MAHISEQVVATLRAQGFIDGKEPFHFNRVVASWGQFGKIKQFIEICPLGRWLVRVDGWGRVEREVDLRNFPNDAKGAIDEVLA